MLKNTLFITSVFPKKRKHTLFLFTQLISKSRRHRLFGKFSLPRVFDYLVMCQANLCIFHLCCCCSFCRWRLCPENILLYRKKKHLHWSPSANDNISTTLWLNQKPPVPLWKTSKAVACLVAINPNGV